MKYKNIIYSLILVCVTLAFMHTLPALLRKATDTPDSYPFVYYGSVLGEFGLIDYKNKEMPLGDMSGKRYGNREFDSLMPLLNYRQLMSDGRLPDSLGGYELTPQLLRATSVIFRYQPKSVSAPTLGLYILFESMPKRLGLEIPPDVFRLRDDIQFINAETNDVDVEKSELFQTAFEKAGFAFPAQWASGNPNQRKPYDEGYFSLDSNGNLFHIKMVNGRPYVRDTRIGEQLDILSFSMYESADRRFYGFLFDKRGGIHIIESDERGGYETRRLDMDPIDPANDQITVMGNLLYWTVTVDTPEGRRYYALETPSLKQVAKHSIARTESRWDKVSRRLFSAYLTLEHGNTSYISPKITFTGIGIANVVAAIIIFAFSTGGWLRRSQFTIYVFVTGLAGLLAMVLIPGFRNKNKQ